MIEDWSTRKILERLISFPTVSADPNIDLIQFCKGLLERAGAAVTVLKDETGTKANLYATIGPENTPGVLLSGHTDVVPVAGQNWTVPPFELTENDGKFFGRGTADMKGFVACALNLALKAAQANLKTPLHLAFSYDEELGCLGVRSLIDQLANAPFQPKLCIVGEPTSLRVATGHKGKTAARLTAIGQSSHSALAPSGLNAIHMACDMIGFIREIQEELSKNGHQDGDYDVPYSTLHVGVFQGGTVLNIVPNHAEFLFEIRNLAGDDPNQILSDLRKKRDAYLDNIKDRFPDAKIEIEITNSYPPLATPKDAKVVQFTQEISSSQGTIKVAFGTEGGLFSDVLGLPTVVCGPGSMDQGHKPDEFIAVDQLAACDDMMEELLSRLVCGV